MQRHDLVIIGSGPAGMSAACRAGARGASHLLLERADHLADTIYLYQRGKYVMATPETLPLRSDAAFQEGKREQVLAWWSEAVSRSRVNVRLHAEVVGIEGRKGEFIVKLGSGELIGAGSVVLAIGVQGNLRKLRVPGADVPWVQYQLDDPEAFRDEAIVVVGAGDSAIENALALARQNEVTIVNRQGEFARAKAGNRDAILAAIGSGEVTCFYDSAPKRVEPGRLWLDTASGVVEVPCDRLIARLGADPPRRFLQSIGLVFPSDDPAAVPVVSEHYESNVPGLYLVGALAGYPLIKQAMNQGYEVVERILGHACEPADEQLIMQRIGPLRTRTVAEAVSRILQITPSLHTLSRMRVRELLLDSTTHAPAAGSVVFERNDYSNNVYFVLEGSVDVLFSEDDPSLRSTLGPGDYFGESGMISGRRRDHRVLAGPGCVLLEVNRRTMIRLRNTYRDIEREMDRVAVQRHLQWQLLRAGDEARPRLAEIAARCEVRRFAAGEILYVEGDEPDGVHIVRKGSVTISRTTGGREVILAYMSAGHYVGEVDLLDGTPRGTKVKASTATETILLPAASFRELLASFAAFRAEVEAATQRRAVEWARTEGDSDRSGVVSFLLDQGLGEATDVLLIDESLCVGCDACEKACAVSHGGTSRLDREAGPTFAYLHVPTSCRHCEDPKCQTDCPPDAIHRGADGEIFINDACIGCGNCERFCPYGVIKMAPAQNVPPPSFLQQLFPSLFAAPKPDPKGPKVAVKCDMCTGLNGGPACVAACPTGAALRVAPEAFLNMSRQR
jgi:CRP-like cAMP-binding protein/Fe-S-cluster-containing hydrogenase component 2/thioredoxin reductase